MTIFNIHKTPTNSHFEGCKEKVGTDTCAKSKKLMAMYMKFGVSNNMNLIPN